MIKILFVTVLLVGCSNQLDVKEVHYSKSLKISQENQLLIAKYDLVSKSQNAPIVKEAWYEYIGNYEGGQFKGRNGHGKHILIAIENCLGCFSIDSFLQEWDMRSDSFNLGIIKNSDTGGLLQLFPTHDSVRMDTVTLHLYNKSDFTKKNATGYIVISLLAQPLPAAK
jgi:hypothetical protein